MIGFVGQESAEVDVGGARIMPVTAISADARVQTRVLESVCVFSVCILGLIVRTSANAAMTICLIPFHGAPPFSYHDYRLEVKYPTRRYETVTTPRYKKGRCLLY